MSEQRSSGTMPAGRQESKRMLCALIDAGGWEPWGSAGGGIKNGGSSSGLAVVYDATVVDDEDMDVLECGICYLPLKPPIFQCAKGHVVCSLCSVRLKNAVNCHVCSITMPGGYQRCHAMERVVDSVRMRCPHALYGCDARTPYHAREEHLLECPHGPCHCPGDACGFIGRIAMLLIHLEAVHGWPCTAEVHAGNSFGVYLRDGFNFLSAVRGSTQYLLLLNMASTPFGHAISAVWIQSLTAMVINSSAAVTTCELELKFAQFNHVPRGHYQKSRFQVEGMCPPLNGLLPDPNASFQFFVPKYAGGNEAPVHVTAMIFI